MAPDPFHLNRRQMLTAVTAAQAQDFPSRPIRIMVGAAAGGGSDAFARLIATKLNELWNQPVVVENRTGASSTIAADFVAKPFEMDTLVEEIRALMNEKEVHDAGARVGG